MYSRYLPSSSTSPSPSSILIFYLDLYLYLSILPTIPQKLSSYPYLVLFLFLVLVLLSSVMILYDMDAVSNSFQSVIEAFSPKVVTSDAFDEENSSPSSAPKSMLCKDFPTSDIGTSSLPHCPCPCPSQSLRWHDVDSRGHDRVSKARACEVDYLHCFAVKSCPLSYILHRAVSSGLGLECASIMEVHYVPWILILTLLFSSISILYYSFSIYHLSFLLLLFLSFFLCPILFHRLLHFIFALMSLLLHLSSFLFLSIILHWFLFQYYLNTSYVPDRSAWTYVLSGEARIEVRVSIQ